MKERLTKVSCLLHHYDSLFSEWIIPHYQEGDLPGLAVVDDPATDLIEVNIDLLIAMEL